MNPFQECQTLMYRPGTAFGKSQIQAALLEASEGPKRPLCGKELHLPRNAIFVALNDSKGKSFALFVHEYTTTSRAPLHHGTHFIVAESSMDGSPPHHGFHTLPNLL